MNGLWVLFLLILTAALPLIAVYIWFKVRKYPLSLPWFLLSLLAGVLALPLAALLQYFFPPARTFPQENGPALIFLGIFIRIALTEELSRLAVLFILFRAGLPVLRRFGPRGREDTGEARISPEPPLEPAVLGAASGLLAGLGFALVENALYGAADIAVTLLRAFTAAPLHGACGARVGQAVTTMKHSPVRALLGFSFAVLIHGMYNFMLISPGIPPFLPVLIALSALASSILAIHRSDPAV
jgi:RsiW-degrading membrane proteinase PrsW (M82 family)